MAFRSSTADASRRVLDIGMRVAIAASTTTLFLGATACSTGGSAKTDTKTPDNALSKIGACALVKPKVAAQTGLPGQGEPSSDIESEPSCTFYGDYAGISVDRVAGDTLEEYGKRPVWSAFKRIKINGRDGAEAHQTGAPQDQCTTVISAGGGVVAVNSLAVDPRKPFDACAESLKVAKLIEPDLPK